SLLVLRLDGFRAAARRNLLFLVLDLRDEGNHPAGVLLKFGRLRVDVRFENRGGHSQTSRENSGAQHCTPGTMVRRKRHSIRSLRPYCERAIPSIVSSRRPGLRMLRIRRTTPRASP